jgi:hypothetical protein
MNAIRSRRCEIGRGASVPISEPAIDPAAIAAASDRSIAWSAA